MFKPSGILTFTDSTGKPHLLILQESMDREAKIKRDAYKAGFNDGRKVMAGANGQIAVGGTDG